MPEIDIRKTSEFNKIVKDNEPTVKGNEIRSENTVTIRPLNLK